MIIGQHRNMKYVLSVLAIFVGLFAFGQKALTGSVNSALAKGNASELAPFLAKNVSVEINGNEKIYSQGQAENVLDLFFKRTKPKAFDVKHASGPNKTGNNFNIGILRTENGTYRLTYLLKDGPQGKPRIRKVKLVKIVR
jgi:hypothetical protein